MARLFHESSWSASRKAGSVDLLHIAAMSAGPVVGSIGAQVFSEFSVLVLTSCACLFRHVSMSIRFLVLTFMRRCVYVCLFVCLCASGVSSFGKGQAPLNALPNNKCYTWKKSNPIDLLHASHQLCMLFRPVKLEVRSGVFWDVFPAWGQVFLPDSLWNNAAEQYQQLQTNCKNKFKKNYRAEIYTNMMNKYVQNAVFLPWFTQISPEMLKVKCSKMLKVHKWS